MRDRERYGVDAPGAVRTLGWVGAVLLLGSFLPARVPGAAMAHALWPSGVSCLLGAGWMLLSSLWLKKRVMRALLDQRQWRGDETVLDVGCGRGLVTVEAARRVPQGSVHGVDIWQSKDLSGNTPEALRANTLVAGVSARVVIDSGDARALPYEDESYDVVCSMTALHNIPDEEGRRKAVAEIWRVLRPGGQALIFDIRHARRYMDELRVCGARDAAMWGPVMLWGPMGWRLRVRKPMPGEPLPEPISLVEGTWGIRR